MFSSFAFTDSLQPELRHSNTILFLIVVIGILLQFYHIGFQCYWTEELYTLQMARLSFSDIITTSLTTDVNPPLYYLFAHASMITFEFVVVSIRYVSAFFGIATIPAMYFLGKTYKNEITGLICAGISAVLYPLVYYSQFGRAYAMSWFFFILTLILYIRIKDGDTSYGRKITFAILSALCIWTHLFLVVPISLMFLDLLYDYGRGILIPAILTTILCSPILQIPLTLYKTRIIGVSTANFGMSFVQIPYATITEFFGSAYPILLALSVVGYFHDKSRIKTNLLTIAIATIVIILVCSIFTPVFPRYYMSATFIFILFAAGGISELAGSFRANNIDICVIVFIIMVIIFALQYPDYIVYYFRQKYIC